MAVGFARTKKVVNLLDEKARARLSGDDGVDRHLHIGGAYTLYGFFHEEGEDPTTSRDDASARDIGPCPDRRPVASPARIRDLMTGSSDRFATQLAADVERAAERFGALRRSKPSHRRAVMGFLRDVGHNAGVCKSKWDGKDGVAAGDYEYIDVLKPCSGERYIVDLDFSAEFEIARATEEYRRVVGELPVVFVGRAAELRQAVRLLAEGAKRSMRARDMNLPPWRKARYVHNKWLGPYKRTTSVAAAEAAGPAVVRSAAFGKVWEAKCREVGFVPARQHIVPAARMR